MGQSQIPTKWTPEIRRPGNKANDQSHSSDVRCRTHNPPHVFVKKTIINNRENFATFHLFHMGLFLVPRIVQRRIPQRHSSCEVNSSSYGQEIPNTSRNQKFHYRIHKRRSLFPPRRVMHPSTPILYVSVISTLIL
jgi:hypothetical protein